MVKIIRILTGIFSINISDNPTVVFSGRGNTNNMTNKKYTFRNSRFKKTGGILFSLQVLKTTGLLCLLLINVQLSAQKTTQVKFSADITKGSSTLGSDVKVLVGNVVFLHENAKMYCDSAYFYSDKNSLDAFSHVYINQGDTLHLYGDFLNYNGNTRMAKIRRNVKLLYKETTLTTESLDFDMGNNVGYYTDSAHIVRGDNILTSKKGYYYTRKDLFAFKNDVVVKNPDYTIYSDTMDFNTESEITYFFGPTSIISKKNSIYCEKGWYNTQTNVSQLYKNAYMVSENQCISGDSLYYERENGYGVARSNVEIIDTAQHVIMKGNYAVYHENEERSMLTDSALFIQVGEKDSLYLHADTLRSELDTAGQKVLKAYYHVKLFKSDFQGKCDSMSYSFADSIIRLYNDPVLWYNKYQETATFIEILTKNRNVDQMRLDQKAFIISRKDTSMFDQIKGKNMICYFNDGEMQKINVNGNSQTIYYPEDDSGILGMNKSASSDMVIYFEDGEIDYIKFLNKPESVLYPLSKVPENEKRLSDFKWLERYRAKSKDDVFRWVE